MPVLGAGSRPHNSVRTRRFLPRREDECARCLPTWRGIAAVNLDDLSLALSYFQRIVELADAAGYSDRLLANDRQSVRLIQQEIQRPK